MTEPRPFWPRRASAFSRKRIDGQERSRVAVPIFTIPTATCSKSSIWFAARLPRAMRSTIFLKFRLDSRLEVEHAPKALEVAELNAAGGGRATDIIENLAVLESIIGQPLDPPLFVEVDRDHALVD